MIVKIYTLKNGLEVIEDVEVIRIKCQDYNLLILKNYMPILGKINGNVEIEYAKEKRNIENIKAFYTCCDNVFNLLIEGE